MDAHRALMTDIFNNATLVEIPFFQRTYVWKEDLWARFLQDMEYVSSTNQPHFFGTLILKKGEKPTPGDIFTSRWTIVDGQQRITTLFIFMKALCLKLNQELFFNSWFRIMGQVLALRHGKNDIDAFEKVMALTEPVKLEDYALKSRIVDAYHYFLSNIDTSKLNIMTIRTNSEFVRIDLDPDENEQQIFDTINSLGVGLTTSELLKNYFFSRETIHEYKLNWESVFEKDDETKAYWDTEIDAGRSKKALIDIFFDAYFQLFVQDKQYNISTEDKLAYSRIDGLSQSYQHFINKYCQGDKSIVVTKIKAYADCFRNIFTPSYCERNIPAVPSVDRINIIIFGLKTSTMIPYVLYIAQNADPEEFPKMLAVLESYIMRRMITHETTKNYNNLFTALILNKILDADSLRIYFQKAVDSTTSIPTDADLLNGFQTSKLVNIQAKGIIYLIESKIRPSNIAVALLGFNSYSLEHLMPKKWRNNWEQCTSEELAQARDRKLLTLGNLAIITQSLNASIRDASWDIKKEGKGINKPGLQLCASGLATLHDALQKPVWNEAEIDARALQLYDKAIEIWKL